MVLVVSWKESMGLQKVLEALGGDTLESVSELLIEGLLGQSAKADSNI